MSDQGSQLLSAGQVLAKKESPESWDWEKIKSENSTSVWKFVPVGCQHYNGLPESTIKVLKRSLKLALEPGVILAYDELVTLLARITCSVNLTRLGYQELQAIQTKMTFYSH